MKSLEERLQNNSLKASDIESLLSILKLVVTLRTLLDKGRFRILFWLRMVFGIKTEKTIARSRKPPSDSAPKKKGRYGRDDFPGADKTKVDHPNLKEQDPCPECLTGKLREIEPGVDYDWQGSSPIHLHIYLLQRFICHKCKTFFTAPSPVAESAKTVDDSEDEKKVTKCNRNAMANAVVACLRYMFGIPCYRLAKIQAQMGIGLPEANQYSMIAQVYDAALSIYHELIYQAAQGSLILADDTGIKILDWLAGKGPPAKSTGKPKKLANTSAIVSKSAGRKPIVLYLTGSKQAGRNVESILDHRLTQSGVPIYMCDGLKSNHLGKDYYVILVNCLDHGRLKFYDLKEQYPTECQKVLDLLSLVYKADKEAKSLSPEQRLDYHQKHSQKPMDELGQWMQKTLKSGETEENSPLGGAMKYMLDRWSEFNEFLHTPGVPLSNAECERTIKQIIIHRKNSLFYKTEKGAQVGDVIQSLIATCQQSGVSPFKYLAWLQENKSKVKQHPESYLPWCYPA